MIVSVTCSVCSGYTVACDKCGMRCYKCSNADKSEAVTEALAKGWKTYYDSVSSPAKYSCPQCEEFRK
jgi:hypothetical protein